MKNINFLKIKNLGLKIIFKLLKLFTNIPYNLQINSSIYIGKILYPILKKRKNITLTNLKIAFPNKKDEEIYILSKKCFESISISGIETMIAWFMTKKKFNKIIIETFGIENFLKIHNNTKEAGLMLGAHFTCMEIIGRYIGENNKNFYVVYQKHKNKIFEKTMTESRNKYVTQSLQRKNVISIVKALKRKSSVWYAPDQDFGAERSMFIPFFGKKCSTLIATSWLAEKSKAKVIPCYYFRKKNLKGYNIYVLPPLKNFPSKEKYKDAERYHKILEKTIYKNPDQYLWQHRRYKTRPKGETNIYK